MEGSKDMEEHVRKQRATVADETEIDQNLESEKLPITNIANIKTMSDIVDAIKQGDEDVGKALMILVENSKHLEDSIAGIAVRIASIEMFMEAQQLSNVSMFDKLAKIGMALVTFVSKFGTKKDADEAKNEVEVK